MAAGNNTVGITEGSGKNVDTYETTAGYQRQRVIIAGYGTSDDVQPIAHDAADAGSPLKIGGKATLATPTAVAAADRVDAWFDPEGSGHTVAVREANRMWIPGIGRVLVSRQAYNGNVTATTGVSIVSALASNYTYVVGFAASTNQASGTLVRLLSGSGGTAVLSFHTIQYQPVVLIPSSIILCATAVNTALFFDVSAGTPAVCQVNVFYFQSSVVL